MVASAKRGMSGAQGKIEGGRGVEIFDLSERLRHRRFAQCCNRIYLAWAFCVHEELHWWVCIL